ncbi:MAG: biotin synthase BioB [Clostridium sp.]|uniref:biotin synthase BioB n=1 Tax=Clostridium sp. TaxID=1506 RepID=UPI002FCA53FE
MDINKLVDSIIEGYKLTRSEALELYNGRLEDLISGATRIRENIKGNNFDLCTIINGKSGKCSEDCKYCSQSAHYNTGAKVYPMLPLEEIVNNALKSHIDGINRFSIVTSGKRLSDKDLDYVCKCYEKIKSLCSIKLCASHGLLSYKDFKKLKKAGVTRYHNNLETSANYFKNICTTHSYEEKIESIKEAQSAGLVVCSGGIFGLGEGFEDRVDMAIQLRELNITTVPINILNPILGTPLENNKILDQEDIIKSIAIYRFLLPTADLRLAGGRIILEDNGAAAIKAGINAAITGNMLTTLGSTVEDDVKMVSNLGFSVGYYE